MKIQYIEKRFGAATLGIIAKAELIIQEYMAQGYILTLRQLYYRFVAKDLFPDDRRWRQEGSKWIRDENGTKNAPPNYKWLGSIISDARLAGLISWGAFEDRTRHLRSRSHWTSAGQVIEAAKASFYMDKWEGQPVRFEVWIEKDALVGVIEPICRQLDVAFFSCRGYTSQSELWKAGQRLLAYEEAGISPIVLHLGDHDPSGIDMTRDILERLQLFGCRNTDVSRIALNMDQVEEFGPPPNPAKLTDTRARGYIIKYGDESWELDALEPAYMNDIIKNEVLLHRDEEIYQDVLAREQEQLAIIDDMLKGVD